MSTKPAPPRPADHGSGNSGKGLDALGRFILQSWGSKGRIGLWAAHGGLVSAPKAPFEPFLLEHLDALWHRDEVSAVITLEPPYDPFVTLLVTTDHRHLGPETKYKPSHWAWKVVPLEAAVPGLKAAQAAGLAEAEQAYLQELQAGVLQAHWA